MHPISASIAPMHPQQSPPVLPDSGSSGLSSRRPQIVQYCGFLLLVIIRFRYVPSWPLAACLGDSYNPQLPVSSGRIRPEAVANGWHEPATLSPRRSVRLPSPIGMSVVRYSHHASYYRLIYLEKNRAFMVARPRRPNCFQI